MIASNRYIWSVVLWIVIGFSHSYATEPLMPVRTHQPPTIDGVLDDDVWKEAPYETGFKTWYPDYGQSMAEETRVWFAYDRENLYFAFRCFDSQPDKIKASVTARDKIRPDDWICLNLDTFNDQQSLYALYSNPLGIQMDSRAIGDDEDVSVDVVWYSEGRIDDLGYTVEVRIPFKSIRFSHHDPVEMGVIFERRISRTSEMGTYPALDPMQGPNFYTQTRTLIYQDVKHYRLIEVLPAVTYGNTRSMDEGKLVFEGEDAEASLTTKVGITSHLVFDGTVNPDFSQVEADAGQVDFNQRFALFYPEKRPFFLEGREHFNFGGASSGDPLGAVVHTRMIVDPLVGGKLTGKMGDNNTIALIYALDELPQELKQGEYAHFAIVRYKRALNQDSFIGGFLTARELDNSSNRVCGTDGQIRINGSSRIGFHAFLSQSEDRSQSTKDDGHALGVNYYYNTRDWLMNLRLHELSDDFQTETGYVTRIGITRIRAGVIRMFYPHSKFLLRIDPLVNNQFIYDKDSQQWENYNGLYLNFVLPRSSNLRIGYAYATEIFRFQKFSLSRISLDGQSQLTKQLYITGSYVYGKKIRYIRDPGLLPYQGRGSTASASVVYQPSEKFHSRLDYTYEDFTRESDDVKEYDYSIVRFRNTYQMNRYLFFRIILEYNSFHEELLTDFLASFTYIPGTVIHIGYGSFYEKTRWVDDHYEDSSRFLETKRGLFFKASYLWRL